MEDMQALEDNQKKEHSFSATNVATAWKAPPLNFLKANWDASMDKKRGKMGVGVVIRDYHRKMWATKCMTREDYLDPMSAEVMAATMAAQFCNELGVRTIFLEGDAKNMVEVVKSISSDESSRGHLFTNITLAPSSFQV
jgi:hypothetical protein